MRRLGIMPTELALCDFMVFDVSSATPCVGVMLLRATSDDWDIPALGSFNRALFLETWPVTAFDNDPICFCNRVHASSFVSCESSEV